MTTFKNFNAFLWLISLTIFLTSHVAIKAKYRHKNYYKNYPKKQSLEPLLERTMSYFE